MHSPGVFAPQYFGGLFGRKSRPILNRPRGLWNLGYTCHLGSALTALSASASMRHWFSSLPKEHPMVSALRDPLLLAAGADGDALAAPLDPRFAVHALSTTGWNALQAQDAHETMGRVLEALENAAAPPPTAIAQALVGAPETPAPTPVTGSTCNALKCLSCLGVTDTRVCTSGMLSVGAAQKDQKLLDAVAKDLLGCELVDLRCVTCKRTTRQLMYKGIAQYPDVLVLHLQRGIFSYGVTAPTRYSTEVPEEFELPLVSFPLVVGGLSEADRPQRPCVKYRVTSVVHHHASSGREGHFTASVLKAVPPSMGLVGLLPGVWWCVNDGRVSRCSTAVALEPTTVYLLVCEKVFEDPNLGLRRLPKAV